MTTKNILLTSLKLLMLQIFMSTALSLILWFLIIKFNLSLILTLFFLLLLILTVSSLPSLMIGYLYSKRFKQIILVKDRKIISLMSASALTLIAFFSEIYKTEEYFKVIYSLTQSGKIFLYILMYILIFSFWFIAIFYFLKIGNNLYLKK